MKAPVLTADSAPGWLGMAGVALCLLVVVATAWRDAGTYAHTFADERTYSYYSRVMPVEDAPLPSYLYLKTFSATRACGDGALGCARLFNALFFAAALPFIFFVARRFASWRSAALITMVTALGPFNSYTAYFMPESMYFFGVWVLLWLLTLEGPLQLGVAPAAGALVGLLALVKLHGLFLAPSAVLIVGFAGFERARFRGALSAMAAFAAALLAVRFGVGYLLGGSGSLSVLGALYSGQAEAAAKPVEQLALEASVVLFRHIQALVILFVVPLAALFTLAPASTTPANGAVDPLRRLQAVSILFLGPLLLVVSLFSAKVGGQSVYELSDRLHMRYYNFLLPLLPLVAAAHLDHKATWPRPWPLRRLIPASLVLVIGIYAIASGIRTVVPVPADCPDLEWLNASPKLFVAFAIAGLFTLVVWAVRPRWGGALYLFALFPLGTFAATHAITSTVTSTSTPTVYDTGAEVTRRLLGSEGVERVHVITPDAAAGFRAIFTLNNQSGSFDQLEPGSRVTRPAEKDALLLFGEYIVDEPHRVLVRGEGYSLVAYE